MTVGRSTSDWLKEQARRKAAIDLHRARLGDWCPGLGKRSAHDVLPPNTLTAGASRSDSADPRTILVLCRACAHVLRQRRPQPSDPGTVPVNSPAA